MNTISSRNNWIFEKCDNILKNKDAIRRQIIMQMLNKTIKMFEYENLPDTIEAKDLEIQLMCNGYTTWAKVEDKLYTFFGGLGGEPNPYYLPTLSIIANPALKYNASLKINEECVVMLNDYLYQGLMPLFNKYGSLLTEAEISLKFAIINARVPALVEADNDNTHKSATNFFAKVEDGEEYGVIATKEFFDGIRSHDFYKENYIKEIIESIQYIKGSWYNEIGLNAAFNMKREAINEAEATLNEDILYPTVDDMLECRQKGLDRVNKMFGTNIKVRLSSIWEHNRKQDKLILQKEKAEVEEIKEEATDDETERNV